MATTPLKPSENAATGDPALLKARSQFVFTIPRVLRGIFRKRRDLLHILFQTATDTLPKTQDGKTQDSRQKFACAKAVL